MAKINNRKGTIVIGDFLTKIVTNSEFLIKKLENAEERVAFFLAFPFEEFANISIIDQECFKMAINTLDLFCKNYVEFYSCSGSLNNSMDFILTNLSMIVEDYFQITDLLELMQNIILKKSGNKLEEYFKENKDRIANILLHSLKSIVFLQKTNINLHYGVIVGFLITMNEGFYDDGCFCDIICEIFSILKNNYAITDVCIICKSILNKSKNGLLNSSFEPIYLWLLQQSSYLLPTFLQENEHELLTLLLSSINIFLEQCDLTDMQFFNENFQHFASSLVNISRTLCLLFANELFTRQTLILFKIALEKFSNLEGLFSCSTNQINQLPRNVKDWPKQSNNPLMFTIYHMVIKYKNNNEAHLWDQNDLLTSIMNWFYTDRRHLANLTCLKSIYYLYPVLIQEINEPIDINIKLLGCDLLGYFVNNLSTLPHMYSHNEQQLYWFLSSKNDFLRRTVVQHWLNTPEISVLAEAIKKSKAEKIVIEILLDDTSGKISHGNICAKLLNSLISSSLSYDIALLIPFAIDKPKILNNLLLCEPRVPLDFKNSLLLCTIMAPIIPLLDDSQVLRGACLFSSKLLTKFRKTPLCLGEFCKNIKNIEHLIKIVDRVDENTALEIIRLLKVIVVVQKLNNFKFEDRIVVDFKVFFKGSSVDKLSKSLNLFRETITCNNSLFKINQDDLLELYRKILQFATCHELTVLAHQCVISLFKKNAWLATNYITLIHIEMNCLSTQLAEGSLKSFLNLLLVWMKTLQREPLNGFCNIPEEAICNFIRRSFIPYQTSRKYFEVLSSLMRISRV